MVFDPLSDYIGCQGINLGVYGLEGALVVCNYVTGVLQFYQFKVMGLQFNLLLWKLYEKINAEKNDVIEV